jgi:5,10-methenyltetrahydrofolate synthetase
MEDDSSPCFAHTLVDGHVIDPQTLHDVRVFRKSNRARLYELRKKQSLEAREKVSTNIAAKLDDALGDIAGKTIAAYWPIRGELDLRPWMTKAIAKGARIALPVVIEKDQPVEFHLWTPDCAMKIGKWQIPVPAEAKAVTPDIIIIPLLGVDKEQYRLGNGGGYYDRTLAGLSSAKTIGIGQSFARMDTIYPMPWDIPMQQILLADR